MYAFEPVLILPVVRYTVQASQKLRNARSKPPEKLQDLHKGVYTVVLFKPNIYFFAATKLHRAFQSFAYR